MAPSSPRRTIGGKVAAFARHVTSAAECSRRYGANACTKKFLGTVVDVRVERNHRNRRKTTVRASFDLGGGVEKVAILHLKNVSSIREGEEGNDINRDNNTNQNDNEGDNTAAGEAEAGVERNAIVLAANNNEEINVHGTIWTTEDNHTKSVQLPINGAVIH